MIYSHTLAAIAALICTGVASPLSATSEGSQPDLSGPPYLNKLAKGRGKLWLGTAADIPGPEQQNEQYMSILNDTRIFGQLTPANYMKFEFTEPERNVFNYTGGNVILDIAEANGQYVRCHNLIWSSELPDWLTSRNWTNATLQNIMQSHIENLVTHWSSRCYSWDVVNEALNEDGSFSSNIWYDTIGDSYVADAFAFAQNAVEKTGKDIKLYYNDYNLEYPGTKNTAAANIVKDLQSKGIRIDGVGLESHFIVGETPSKQAQVEAMKSFTSLGVDVARTEIDVRFLSLPANHTGLAQQAQDYFDTIESCMALPRCVGMTVWDFDDQYSWIPSTFAGEGGADLFNATFERKPAYRAVGQALKGQACTVC